MSETEDYHAIRWLSPKIATRKTREVEINATITDDGKGILVSGRGDCMHHLVEDTAILMRKMAAKLCGEGHG
jgi:hypothetical protein